MAAAAHTLRAARRLTLLAICACFAFAFLAAAAEAAQARSCSIAAAPGKQIVPLSDQDRKRPFLLYVPSGYDGETRLPLVMNLHGSGGDGEGQMALSELEQAADARGIAVAAPNGAVEFNNGYAWNVPGVPLVGGSPVPEGTPSDGRYLLHVIKRAAGSVCIDSKRVFFTGFSGGARMTSAMACAHAEVIAAIAPVAGLRSGVPKQGTSGAWRPDKRTCDPTQPVPVMTFHGTADATNPYGGNDDDRWGYSVPQALKRWSRINRCETGPTTRPTTPTVDLIAYGRCMNNASVQLFRVNGGGHTWPGSTQPTANQSISATDRMLAFFKRHPLIRSR